MATPPPPPGTNPYSQQPPAPYGPQGGNPYSVPGPPAPAPRRPRSVKGIAKAVLSVVVIGVVAYGGYTTWFGGAATADMRRLPARGERGGHRRDLRRGPGVRDRGLR